MAFLITPISNDEETKTTDKLYFQELANYWHLENTWNIHMWESEDGFNLGKGFEICTQMGCKRPSEERT